MIEPMEVQFARRLGSRVAHVHRTGERAWVTSAPAGESQLESIDRLQVRRVTDHAAAIFLLPGYGREWQG